MLKEDSLYLDHIVQSLERILSYCSGVDEATFTKDFMMQDACIRQLEIIGEATKKLSPQFKTRYPNIPWKDMAGMRDKLTHNYFDVEIGIVWKTIETDVVFLLKEISVLQKEQ